MKVRAICPNCSHPVERSSFYLSRIKCTNCGTAIRAATTWDIITIIPAIVILVALLYTTWGTPSLWLSFPAAAVLALFYRWLIFPYYTRFVLVQNQQEEVSDHDTMHDEGAG